jgi:hypothetical protein
MRSDHDQADHDEPARLTGAAGPGIHFACLESIVVHLLFIM